MLRAILRLGGLRHTLLLLCAYITAEWQTGAGGARDIHNEPRKRDIKGLQWLACESLWPLSQPAGPTTHFVALADFMGKVPKGLAAGTTAGNVP